MEAFNRGLATKLKQYNLITNPRDIKGEEVQKANTYEMLEKAARELRSIRYDLGRCIQEGLTNFTQL